MGSSPRVHFSDYGPPARIQERKMSCIRGLKHIHNHQHQDIGRIPALAWVDLSDAGMSDTFEDATALTPRVESVRNPIPQEI